jgi:predicted DNA binding CopG/RHH family protein
VRKVGRKDKQYMQIQHSTKNKDKWIKIRCTESQRQYIKQKAKEKDMSISEYIRYLLQNDTATTI